eukprot:g5103.t1
MPSDIVDKVTSFFFEDATLERTFRSFAVKHCADIDYEAEEMKLEYTALHKKFVALYEKMLTDVVEKEGETIEGLYKALRECCEDDFSEGALLTQILIATADFDVFMQLMYETAKEEGVIQRRKEARDCAQKSVEEKETKYSVETKHKDEGKEF